jgi:NAD(P)-dependent dehydrogenase (short-subunit alcohol dehydrogenase family)
LWDDVLAVNLTGTYLCSRLAAGAMVAAGWGRIVNVASVAGLVGGKYVAAYCASKHGVVGLTRALAVELAESSVTVNAVCPGFVQTSILDAALVNVQRATGRDEAAARAAVLAGSLQRRVVEPEEVAATVVWLCGEGAGAVTGQAIAVEASGTIS